MLVPGSGDRRHCLVPYPVTFALFTASHGSSLARTRSQTMPDTERELPGLSADEGEGSGFGSDLHRTAVDLETDGDL